MTEREIKFFDKSNMFDVLLNFDKQVEDACFIGKSIKPQDNYYNFNKIIISGMGGSAVSGDLLRSLSLYESPLPIFINRNYLLPAFADENTLVILSSYSGNTEETLSSYSDAMNKKCKIICVSSGGKLSLLAETNKQLLITIPKGYQPRCALGYSFFPLLFLLVKLNVISNQDKNVAKTLQLIKKRAMQYSKLNESENNSLKIANYLEGKIPVIYSSIDFFDIVNLRWRGQLSENAKTLAYGNYFPEMNHNEIVGWQENSELIKKFAVIVLRDKENLAQIKKRMDISVEIIKPYAALVLEIEGEGESLLERVFDVIYLGDWMSFYLSILHKTDPTPVEKINFLKNKLMEN